jgi:hypothetical protein
MYRNLKKCEVTKGVEYITVECLNGFVTCKCIIDSVDDQPAFVTKENTKRWYKDGLIHRSDDKPAVVGDNIQMWYQNGVYHRDGDKPTIVYSNGTMYYHKNGKYHRDLELGPAVIDTTNNRVEYWMEGVKQDVKKNE